MAKKRNGSGEGVGHTQEHPSDPVFVPDLARIEALAEKMSRESLTPERLAWSDIRETICGTTDDSQPVEQYDGSLGVSQAFVNAHQGPVGVLRWHTNLGSIYDNPGNVAGARWCTGTLISDNLFLTAGHCFDQTGGGWNRPRVNGSSNIISPQEIATRMNVEFNFQVNGAGVLQTPVAAAVEELIEYRLDGLDFAIVRLAGTPGQQFGTTGIAPGDAAVGETICIIGHPAGQPKRIEAGPVTSFDGHRIRYNDIDTLGGNSGSGILRESDGCIVGIHTNGGCNAAMTGSNFGLRVSRLREASPTIRGIAAHTGTLRDVIVTTPALDRLTAVITDRIATNIARDTVTSVVRDRLTSLLADRVTSVVADRGTSVLGDRPTNVVLDRGPTSIIADRGTDPIGDRKASGLDKQFSDVPRDPFGGSGRFVRPREAGSARPFVMATPHHAQGGMAGMAQTALDGADLYDELDILEARYAELAQLAEEVAEEMNGIEQIFDDLAAEDDLGRPY